MRFTDKYIKVAGKAVVKLWPPDHMYHTIKLSDFGASIPCNCACLSSGVITKVTSDEAQNGEDDGNTINDIVIANDSKAADLRSEHSGIGNGRVYTIYISVTNASGTVQNTKVQVHVQLDFGTPVVDDGSVYEVLGADLSGMAKTHNEAAQTEIMNARNVLTELALQQNYTNPFNPTITFDFAIPEAGFYTLKVYNPFGQEVAELVNGQLERGFYRINFDASKLASRLYIYALKGNNLNITKKMTLLR